MRRLCTILVILHIAVGTVMGLLSGGRVVCTGSDDHVAIELRHAVCPSASASTPREAAANDIQDNHRLTAAQGSKSCSDYELPGTNVNRSTNSADAASQLILLPFCTLVSVWMAPVADISNVPVRASPPDDDAASSTLSCLRSIVLLS